MVESIRKTEQSVLLLDCGGVFDNQPDTAELILNAMARMGYNALNLGSPEFNFGKEFLQHTRSHVSFPYIASNLLSGGRRLPWTEEYIIKEAGGIKVAVLGILNPDDLKQISHQPYAEGLEVIPPETALNRLLPEVRRKADMVILLSRFDVGKTRALAEATKGIDVAISSGGDEVYYAKPLENTVILQTGSRGKVMGSVKITIDEKGKLNVSKNGYVPLDNSVPGNEEIERLVERHKKAQAEARKAKDEQIQKELMEGLQLTPQEFIERYQKEQTGKRKGEAR